MEIRNVQHKGLRRFLEADDASGLHPLAVAKLRKIVTFLMHAEDIDQLKAMPLWRIHLLTGSDKGKWSLTVTRNWRLTFRLDKTAREIFDLNFEDYH